ncbi:ChaN family lipoprotein [Pseudoxanthomonas suwonensis]|uniref:ChaN family lipoprotein n=1 Tax=Pseudoxanthomonas suwonensis TaxID=314722 RepID=UPI0006977C17|nr:ChaN family lipoprotein [Pseudoxanthomonas suwonensis]
MLAADRRSAEAYILDQFADADLVLLGEDHAIRQTLAFVRDLVPQLHRAGVHNLVVEFGAEEDQHELDRLLTSPGYDADALKRLMFRYNSAWSWVEYRDLYEAAWRLNRSLPAGAPPFRIVNMSYVYRWHEFAAPRTPDVLQRVFWRGTVDGFRARVIEDQVLRRGEKALVLTGTPHAFTRYAMPRVEDNNEGFCGFDANWLGNRLLRRHPDRVVSVLVHQPFPNLPGRQPALVQPAQGAIERIMAELGNAPRGFDLKNAAMGALPDRSYYAMCHPDFTMADLFDGYLFLAPFRELEPATVDPGFVDASNIAEALRNYPDPDWKSPPRDLAGFRAHLAGMAEEIRNRYRSVE